MIKSLRHLVVLILAFALASCGGGATIGNESTGSYCATVKGLVICLTSVRPYYLGDYRSQVDAFPIADCDSDPNTVTPEPFTDHGAVATFNIRALNPNAEVPPSTGVIIESFTVDYPISIDSIGAPPIERYQGFISLVIPAPVSMFISADITSSIIMLDIPRKFIYRDNLISNRYSSINGSYINNYTATITFYGRTDTGDRFSVVANTPFSIGPYNYCS